MSTPLNFPGNDDRKDSHSNNKDVYDQNLFGNYNDNNASGNMFKSLFDDDKKDDSSKPTSSVSGDHQTYSSYKSLYTLNESNYDNSSFTSSYNTHQDTTGYGQQAQNYEKGPHIYDTYPQQVNTYGAQFDPYNPQTQKPLKPLNSKGMPSNWPDLLVEEGNQQLYGVGSLIAGFTTTGIVGIGMAIYFLFILDDSIEKNRAAKIMNWISLIIPIIFYLLMFLGFLLFMIMGFTMSDI